MLSVSVSCPSLSTLSVASIKVNKPDAIVTGWGGNLIVNVIRGDLAAMRSGGVTNVNAGGCLANNTFVSSVTDSSGSGGRCRVLLPREDTVGLQRRVLGRVQ